MPKDFFSKPLSEEMAEEDKDPREERLRELTKKSKD